MEFIGVDIKLFDSLEADLNSLANEACKISQDVDYATQKKWLDSQDVCQILNVSFRTLQYYREKGEIPFTRLERKIYYKSEDVEDFLRRSYHENNTGMENIQINQPKDRMERLLGFVEMIRKSLFTIKINARKRPLNKEIYLTDKELSDMLKLSRRTLQEWRNSGQIPYYKLGGSKILYKESDIQKMLKEHYSEIIK